MTIPEEQEPRWQELAHKFGDFGFIMRFETDERERLVVSFERLDAPGRVWMWAANRDALYENMTQVMLLVEAAVVGERRRLQGDA